MAPDNNWLSFSLSSMEMLQSSATFQPTDSRHYSSFADNFYGAAAAWAGQKPQAMYGEEPENASAIYSAYMQQQQPPKLEDFFGGCGGGDSAETQDSSLTHIYDSSATAAAAAAYFVSADHPNLKMIAEFPATATAAAFSTNSGSEVDDSALAGGQTQSPVESPPELAAYTTSANNNNNNSSSSNAIVATDQESCRKIADTFGQRTSIYRGVTRHRWTGRYEAHLWDNSCRREGKARKGRQVYLGGYDKEEKAARAYDLAALKYWGPTATTNFPIASYTKELEEMKHMTKQEFIASLRRTSSGFSRGASIYRGVTRHHQQGRWQARIGRVAGNKDLYLGTFATEEEAAEAYDIAAIKFRGINAVTNFEMSRYDVEAIAKSPLPIGGMGKRLKLSGESEERVHPLSTTLQTPTTNSISFSAIQPISTTIPCGVPFDISTPYYHHNLFHHLPSTSNPSSSVSSMVTPMTLMPSPGEYFIWPPQSY